MRLLVALALLSAAGCAHRLEYPQSRREPISDELHGVRVEDPYRWLEDSKSPEVQAWMKAQDGLARGQLATLPKRQELHARLSELSYLESASPPELRGKLLFSTHRGATQEKSVVVVKEVDGGAERVLLDPNSWATDGSASLGAWVPSWDGKLIGYNVRVNNSDEATLHVMDVASGKDLPDLIAGTKYGAPSWTPDGSGFYYTWVPTDPKLPPSERPGLQTPRFHRLGTAPATDPIIQQPTRDGADGVQPITATYKGMSTQPGTLIAVQH